MSKAKSDGPEAAGSADADGQTAELRMERRQDASAAEIAAAVFNRYGPDTPFRTASTSPEEARLYRAARAVLTEYLERALAAQGGE